MNSQRRQMKLIGFLLLLFVIMPASALGEDHSNHQKQQDAQLTPEYREFIHEMNSGMDKMMKDMHSSGYTGNPDIDFLAMMIPHHEGAIDMARLVLIYGTDPLVRTLAEEIIASQRAEIDSMKMRLEILKKGIDKELAGYPSLGGTRGKK